MAARRSVKIIAPLPQTIHHSIHARTETFSPSLPCEQDSRAKSSASSVQSFQRAMRVDAFMQTSNNSSLEGTRTKTTAPKGTCVKAFASVSAILQRKSAQKYPLTCLLFIEKDWKEKLELKVGQQNYEIFSRNCLRNF